MASRFQDFNSELWQKWASMGVIFLACGAMLYQDHASPRPPKHSGNAPHVPTSHMKKSTSARRSKGTSLGHYHSKIPLARHQVYRLLLVSIALILVGFFVYLKKHNNARDYTARRYNMMPPS